MRIEGNPVDNEAVFHEQMMEPIPDNVLFAYNDRQREWFKNVYGGKCQGGSIGMKHKCGGDIQIHHIEPQQYLYAQGKAEDEVDREDNGFPLCADAHVGSRGTQDCIHPDQREAQLAFVNGDKDAYRKVQERRNMMAQSGVIYWNDRWDSNIRGMVRNKLDRWNKNKGEPFPKKHHRYQ